MQNYLETIQKSSVVFEINNGVKNINNTGLQIMGLYLLLENVRSFPG